MFKNEITLDDVIEFIIRNRNDREAMDEISKASFPFTTKYLKNNQKQEERENTTITLTPSIPPYGGGITYCSSNEDVD